MIEKTFDEYKQLVDEHLMDFMPSVDMKSSILYESMQYSLTAGGKRIRPVLLLAACEFAGGSIKEALPYACAMEYIHTYSLIHDDLPAMDNDDLRRGIPTNHKMFGDGIATLAGDGLLNTAFEIMYKDLYLHFDDNKALKKRINAAYAIAKGAGIKGMIAGQTADIDSEHKQCSNEMIEYIHINKTGALIVAAVKAGLYLGGASQEMTSDLVSYAECLGFAFQIVDDILDIKGDINEMGKNKNTDAVAEKVTYVSVNGMEKSEEKLQKLTDRAVADIAKYYDNAEFFRDLVLELATRTK